MANRITFGKAPTKTSGSKTAGYAEIGVKGLRDLKACRRLRAVILGVEKKLETDAKLDMTNCFLDDGCASKVRPDNFTGTDEGQKANCQLRARNFGVNGINDDTAETIESIGLGHLIEDNESFEFDGDVIANEAFRTAIEEALSKIKGLPENVIVRKVKRSMKKDAIEWLFANRGADRTFVESALPLLSDLAIRVDYDKADNNIVPDVERVAKLLMNPAFSGIVKDAAGEPDKTLNPPRSAPKKTKKAA